MILIAQQHQPEEYRCLTCHGEFTSKAGPLTCLLCGSVWVKWLSFARNHPGVAEIGSEPR